MQPPYTHNRSGIKIGVVIEPFNGIGVADFMRGIRLLGIEFVELNRTAFAESGIIAHRLKGLAAAFHLPLTAIDGWDFSNSAHEQEIDETIGAVNSRIQSFNLTHAVVHPPEPLADRTEQFLPENLFRNLRRLALPIFLENIPSLSSQEFDEFYRQAQAALGGQLAGMCFDAPHFFVRGEDPLQLFRRFAPRVGCIHLSDCRLNEDSHLSFFCGGELPVVEFLQLVAASGFQGSVTLEIAPPSFDNLEPYIESYMTTLRLLDYPLYLKKRMRLFALRPLIQRFQNSHLQNSAYQR